MRFSWSFSFWSPPGLPFDAGRSEPPRRRRRRGDIPRRHPHSCDHCAVLRSIIAMLNQKHGSLTARRWRSCFCARRWAGSSLHVTAAFHYADSIISHRSSANATRFRDLMFPGCMRARPVGVSLFLFRGRHDRAGIRRAGVRHDMRRATLGHGVVSFFFNTVLIAMAVNAVVAMAA